MAYGEPNSQAKNGVLTSFRENTKIYGGTGHYRGKALFSSLIQFTWVLTVASSPLSSCGKLPLLFTFIRCDLLRMRAVSDLRNTFALTA